MMGFDYEEKGKYNERCKGDLCPALGCEDMSVCVPVTVKPCAEVGEIKIKCLGPASVLPKQEGNYPKPGNICKFVICQKIRVEVPVAVGAKAETGDLAVYCRCAQKEEPCGKSFDAEIETETL